MPAPTIATSTLLAGPLGFIGFSLARRGQSGDYIYIRVELHHKRLEMMHAPLAPCLNIG